jgi:Ni/Fe-hydrogenase subunit HybB-like protein
MLKIKQVLSAVSFLILNSMASAHEITPTSIAVYIQAQDYEHQIRLRSYSQGYWVSQGPMLETAALEVLGTEFGGVEMCDAKPNESKVLVWLRPSMFYNPQMQTFYGKVTAVTFTADGKPLAKYVGEANKRAFFDVKTDMTLNAVYHAAMQAVSAKMKDDAKFQSALSAPSFSLPCATASMLPESKIKFMSIQ